MYPEKPTDVETTQLQPPTDLPEHVEKPAPEGEGGGEQQEEGAKQDALPKLPGYVKEEALREARDATQRVREELRQQRERESRLAGRLDELYRMQQAPAQAGPTPTPEKPDPEPDRATDFAGWLDWNARQTQNGLEELRTRDAERAQQQQYAEQSNAEVAALSAHVAPYVSAYRAKVPDYDHAAQHAQMAAYNRALQNGMAPQQAAMGTQQLLMLTAKVALAHGLDPADVMYHIGKANGYQGTQPPPQQTQQPAPNANGDAGGLERDEHGRFVPAKEPPKSLGSMTGQPGGRVGLGDIDRMSDAEFYAWAKKGGVKRMHGL